MSKKIKNNFSEEKISKQFLSSNKCPQYISFSFRYITSNNSYNFNFFKASQSREKSDVMFALHEKLNQLSKMSWLDVQMQPRNRGAETINFYQVYFEPANLAITKDQKVYVFRFDKQDRRIIAYKESSCSAMYILGFDFDHSAYDHG